MKRSRFAEVYGGEGRIKIPDSPELQVLEALAAGDEERVLSFFREEKQFGGVSAIDCAHGRYEGLEGIRRCVREWYGWFHGLRGEMEPVTQIRAGCRSAVEFVFSYETETGEEKQIPMALAADLRDGGRLIDELRMYMNPRWVEGYPMYRHPIFPERSTHELRTEMTSGVMPAYFDTVHRLGMAHIPDMMTRTEDVCFGSYGPHDEIVVLNQEQFARRLADQEKERARKQAEGIFDPSTFGLSKYVGLSMETIIDDGVICCVEWEQLVTRAGREERYRLSEPGISFYERAADGWLKSVRIIDYAYTEREIDWSKTSVPRREAERINYLG